MYKRQAEDNESNFLLFESILKRTYNILHAWDGEEAVDVYKRQLHQSAHGYLPVFGSYSHILCVSLWWWRKSLHLFQNRFRYLSVSPGYPIFHFLLITNIMNYISTCQSRSSCPQRIIRCRDQNLIPVIQKLSLIHILPGKNAAGPFQCLPR